MKKTLTTIVALLTLVNCPWALAQSESAMCTSIDEMLTEMDSNFDNIKGDIYSGYQGDEYMATKKLPGAIEARIPDYQTVVCQNIFIENEPSKEKAFAKYDELVKEVTACLSDDWTGKDRTKIQDRDKRDYKFAKTVGEERHEIVITAWKQFNGFTVTVRFSRR